MASVSAAPTETGGPVLSVLDRAECLVLLTTQPYGRVVLTHRALPVVLPVNFVLVGTGVLLRVRPGSVLSGAIRGVVVAFQADRVDPAAQTGWSVMVVGRAEEVIDPELRQRVLAQLVPWAEGQRDHVVRIRAEQVTGRRLLQAPVTG